MRHKKCGGIPNFEKFPVYFPVIRNLDNGDEFAVDCVHHHAISMAYMRFPKIGLRPVFALGPIAGPNTPPKGFRNV
jgi:hypothetical protein